MKSSKYIDIATLLREQLGPAAGVVVVVFEEVEGQQKLRAHVAVNVCTHIREQVPQAMIDLATRIHDELADEVLMATAPGN